MNISPTDTNLHIYAKSSSPASISILFSQMYELDNPKSFEDYDNFGEVVSKVVSLDTDSKFDYTYEIPETDYIENPLDSQSFTNNSHPYNKFTISQIYCNDTTVTNKIK